MKKSYVLTFRKRVFDVVLATNISAPVKAVSDSSNIRWNEAITEQRKLEMV